MSEHYGYVCCACFRRGLTTRPPRPDVPLKLDNYGNIVPHGMDEDYEPILAIDFGDWVMFDACGHHHGRLVEQIFLNVWRIQERLAAEALRAGAVLVHDVVANRAAYSFNGIIVPVDMARPIADELAALREALRGDDELSYDIETMTRLCVASIETGNPVVWYHSGNSLGYD